MRDIDDAIAALRAWEPANGWTTQLHAGDLGWALRQEDARPQVWRDGAGAVVAVVLDEGGGRYLAVAPEHRNDPALERRLHDGWRPSDDPWLLFYRESDETGPGDAAPLSEADVIDRVHVQRAAFERSTFTVEAWQRMAATTAYDQRLEFLLRTPTGAPAAAATGWLSRKGACGLLEPVGTDPAHRGHGYGGRVVVATCHALARAGATGVRVVTPARNEAAVALYRSAGFRVVAEFRDLTAIPSSARP